MKTRYWVIAIIILGLLGTFLDKGKDDNIIKSETTKIQTTEAETTEEIAEETTLQETTTALETQSQPITQAYSQPNTSSVMGEAVIAGVEYAAYLRESEDLNSTVLAEIPVNSEVRVYDKGSEVSRVLYNGNVGYVRSKFLAQ